MAIPFYFGNGCAFLNDQKGTKESPGAAFDEHLAAPVLIGGLPPDPRFPRNALLKNRQFHPAGKDKICDSSCLGPLGPTQ